jgi:hypothetical protein
MARTIYVVSIGIDLYRDPRISNLSYAATDARAVHERLTRTLPKDCCATLLLDKDATLSCVRKEVGETLARLARTDDVVILFFAGHGAPERKLSITLRQYLLGIREQLRGLLDGIESLVLGRVDPDGSGWA